MIEPPAYVTVTDAAGRVLFRRLATDAEIEEARQIAVQADAEANSVLKAIAKERTQVLPSPAAAVDEEPQIEAMPEEPPKDIFDSFAGLKVPKKEKEEEAPAFTDLGDDLDFLGSLDGGGD